LAFEYAHNGTWYEVVDPKLLGRRAELTATGPRVMLFATARKVGPAAKELLVESYPQQSDYAEQLWSAPTARAGGRLPKLRALVKRVGAAAERRNPVLADMARRTLLPRTYGMAFDKAAFRKVKA
jgi:hypothetical protein